MEFEIFNRSFYFLANEEQRNKLLNFLHGYLIDRPAALFAVGICGVIVILLLVALFLKGKKRQILNGVMAGLYTLVLMLIFLCNRDAGVREFRITSMSDYILPEGYHESMIILAVLYVLAFIPFGFLLKKAMGRKHKLLRFVMIVVMAIGIEALQYAFARGVTSGVDAGMYCIGAYIGVIIMSFFQLIGWIIDKARGRGDAAEQDF